MTNYTFFDRDMSWLSFNERILMEAAKDDLPLLERINFLAIYSSNLDEFYRVRMPAIILSKDSDKTKTHDPINNNEAITLYKQATTYIYEQLRRYGNILSQQVIPQLKQHRIEFIYNMPIPGLIDNAVQEYFFSQVLAFIQPVNLREQKDFFPENNKLYIAVIIGNTGAGDEINIINIPSNSLPRFFSIKNGDTEYIVFLDDIIKANLVYIFPETQIKTTCSFKITRDAELDLQDEYEGDIAEKIEVQLGKRELGFATRFLYEPGIPMMQLQLMMSRFRMYNASVVEGGVYHNLKDLFVFPVKDLKLSYTKWPAISLAESIGESLFTRIASGDIILHTPYQSYSAVLRFFNEAAIDCKVTEIYVTLYRIAADSKIGNALISAAKNGKKVTVFVELKARFDEENNLRWAKKMKAAGVKIIYSIPGLKVHAKVALVKRTEGLRNSSVGLLSTGNFNESTAKVYTDHILFTAHTEIMRELDLLFIFLSRREKPAAIPEIHFKHLLVAQFNLQQYFIQLIDREILNAKKGKESGIIIKLNNLEEKKLISKLYEASIAGVKVQLIVRSICCLIPGLVGMSENICITRIVDRYLEHGRIFIFHNEGKNDMWLGSSDWMNRNIYKRIEVCFPIYAEVIREQIKDMVSLQLQDTLQAVNINSYLDNVAKPLTENPVQSQHAIWQFLAGRQNKKPDAMLS